MSEIDVKVARMMGQPFWLHHQRDLWLREGGFLNVDSGVWRVPGPDPNEQEEWEPSSRLDHAMEVVDRMRNDWFSFKCWQPAKEPICEDRSPIEIAIVSFICSRGPCPRHKTTHENHHGAYDIEGETLPLAICKAALLALGAR